MKSSYVSEVPAKPEKEREQISMLWDAVYNHIPTKLRELAKAGHWRDIKINFILTLIAIVMILVSVTLVVVLTGE